MELIPIILKYITQKHICNTRITTYSIGVSLLYTPI